MNKPLKPGETTDIRTAQFFTLEGLQLFSDLVDLHFEKEGGGFLNLVTGKYRAVHKSFLYNLKNSHGVFDLSDPQEFKKDRINPVRIIHAGGCISIPGSETLKFTGEEVLAICRGELQRNQLLLGGEAHPHVFSAAIARKKKDRNWEEVSDEISSASPLHPKITAERLERLYLCGGWSISPLEVILVGNWMGSLDMLLKTIEGNVDLRRGR